MVQKGLRINLTYIQAPFWLAQVNQPFELQDKLFCVFFNTSRRINGINRLLGTCTWEFFKQQTFGNKVLLLFERSKVNVLSIIKCQVVLNSKRQF